MGFARGSLAAVVAILATVSFARSQEPDRRKEDRIELDFSFDYEPEELREHVVETIRWKRIWGPIGIAGYHVFPAQRTGANTGPPRAIWTNGFGNSLWRDPVTGWPLQ